MSVEKSALAASAFAFRRKLQDACDDLAHDMILHNTPVMGVRYQATKQRSGLLILALGEDNIRTLAKFMVDHNIRIENINSAPLEGEDPIQ